MRFCVVISSGGSVIREVLKVPDFSKNIYSIVTDRNCNAQPISQENNIKLKEIFVNDSLAFSNLLLQYCKEEKINFILSFHVRLYKGNLLKEYKNKIINFHLSLLPAFTGFNSFKNALTYGVKILGSTVHFIDETIDLGLPILQTFVHNNPNLTKGEIRHLLFIQQCKSFIQIVSWLSENRIVIIDKGCIIINAIFNNTQFVPALDNLVALNFNK